MDGWKPLYMGLGLSLIIHMKEDYMCGWIRPQWAQHHVCGNIALLVIRHVTGRPAAKRELGNLQKSVVTKLK